MALTATTSAQVNQLHDAMGCVENPMQALCTLKNIIAN